jgi:hypothetical protein
VGQAGYRPPGGGSHLPHNEGRVGQRRGCGAGDGVAEQAGQRVAGVVVQRPVQGDLRQRPVAGLPGAQGQQGCRGGG